MASASPLDYTALDAPTVLDKSNIQDDFTVLSTITEVHVPGLDKTVKIYTEEVSKKGGAESKTGILFLHGMRFSSKNWLDIQSLHHVANWGFRAVAVDLPGYGKSLDNKLGDEHTAAFLAALIKVLKLERPVIVSPSMSGRYSLPFLFEDGTTSSDKALGYVPVAPIETPKFVQEFKKSQLPTLIVCGTNDTSPPGEASNRDFVHLPKGQFAPIEGAGHACYLDNPDAFHKLLFHFLSKLK